MNQHLRPRIQMKIPNITNRQNIHKKLSSIKYRSCRLEWKIWAIRLWTRLEIFLHYTKFIAHPSVAEMIASHYDYGKIRFNEFMKGLDTEECSFYQPIKNNKTDFFQQNAGDSRGKTLKEDCHLFSIRFSYPASLENVTWWNFFSMRISLFLLH